MAGLAAVAGAAIAIPLASPAAADPGDPLGPTIVKTDQAPTGYAVKFRYQAPAGVTSVQIYGDWFFAQPPNSSPNHPPSQWQPNDFAATDWRILPMTQGSDGVWETTVPLPAGTFRYAFTHNCTNQLATGCTLNYDPANPWQIFPQYPGAPGAVRSTIFVPSHPDFPTYNNDYQRPPAQLGTLESVRYPAPASTNPAGVHDMLVYTPKGYDPNRETPYPTLYLSHGSGDHSTAWFMQGVAHYIVQNAIDAGEVQDMVVVSTDFNGLPGGNNGYATHLRDVVFPYMESHYNVSTRPEDRAFAGFSAGGSRACTILYDFTDLFAHHAVWSAACPAANAAQVARMQSVKGGIMIGTGRQDLTTTFGPIQTRSTALKAQGIPVVEYFMDGMHTWHVWRPLLNFYIHNITFRATSTSLAVSTAPSGATLSATVSNLSNGQVPTGNVTFFAGTTEVGSAALVDGVATLVAGYTPEVLANGVVAKYQGSAVYNQSSSETATVTVPAWNSSTIYNTGDMVSYDGAVWRASWWTKNQVPGSSTSGPWQEIATGPDGLPVWTASRIFNAGDIATYNGSTWLASWWTQNQVPGSPTGPWQEIVVDDEGNAVWTPSRIFDAGAVVVHNGQKYVAQWWTRNQVPGQAGGPWKLTS
jgi:enterochelin esterase-like enzyme/chitodextrinase